MADVADSETTAHASDEPAEAEVWHSALKMTAVASWSGLRDAARTSP